MGFCGLYGKSAKPCAEKLPCRVPDAAKGVGQVVMGATSALTLSGRFTVCC